MGTIDGVIFGNRMIYQRHTCPDCGVSFAIDAIYDAMVARGKVDEDGECVERELHCPNGHTFYRGLHSQEDDTPRTQLQRECGRLKRENDKLRRQVGQLKHDLEQAEAGASSAWEEAELVYSTAAELCQDTAKLTAELAKRRDGRGATARKAGNAAG